MAATTGMTLEDVLGHVYLTEKLQAIKTGIPDVLPAEFYSNAITDEVPADEARYVRVEGTRKTARRLNYESRSRQRDLKAIGAVDVKLWHAREFIHLNAARYLTLRAYDKYELQPLGQQEIDRQLTEFASIFDNTEIAVTTMALAKGAMYWDRDGNLRTTTQASSGGVDIDFAIPANNQNQLNGIIGASWATSTTDIQADVRQIRKQALQNTGYPIRCCFYGENLPSYISQNDTIKAYWQFNQGMNQHLLSTNEIPDGFLGIEKWIPVYESFYEDFQDTIQEFFGGDTVVFTPSVDKTWFQRFKGGYPMPTTFQPINGMPQLSAGVQIVHGKFSYGTFSHDPEGLDVYMGHTCLPAIRNGNAIFIADVTP